MTGLSRPTSTLTMTNPAANTSTRQASTAVTQGRPIAKLINRRN